MRKFYSIADWLDYMISGTCYSKFYPTAIMKQVDNITIDDIYKVFERYKEEDKISVIYEVICPNCFNILGTYDEYGDIPDEFEYCIKCDNENIERSSNVVVLYKIIR